MGENITKVRKERSDKKKQIRPTVSVQVSNLISRVSYITDSPIKDVAETILKEGLSNHIVIECLSDQFQRDYWFGQTLFIGKDEFSGSRIRRVNGEKDRISFRLVKEDAYSLADIAYSLNLTENSAAALILETICYETNFIGHYVNSCVTASLDTRRRKQLKILLNEMSKYSASPNEDIDFFWVLNRIADGSKNIKKSIERFLDDNVK